MGHISTLKLNIMKASGMKTNGQVGVEYIMLMAQFMKESGMMMSEVDKACWDWVSSEIS